jgi:hypothetical protein
LLRRTFSLLAKSLVSGPLKETELDHMKCSTVDPSESGIIGHGGFGGAKEAQHVICLYFDDVFAEVMPELTCPAVTAT